MRAIIIIEVAKYVEAGTVFIVGCVRMLIDCIWDFEHL